MSLKKLAPLSLSLTALLTLSSCASFRGTHQRVKINSEPAGATVLFEGKKLGQTPGFFEIPRRKNGEFTLKYPNGTTRRYPLTSTYRWGESFGTNFIWLATPIGLLVTPVGWSVDLLTGSAWEYFQVKVPPLSNTPGNPHSADRSPGLPTSKIVAIAPPQARNALISEEIGRKLEELAARRFPDAQILRYEDTSATFDSFHYNHSNVVSAKFRDKLYYELNANYILETTTENTNDGIVAKSKLIQIFTDEEVEHFEEKIPNKKLATQEKSWLLNSLVSLIPNTAFIDFSYSSFSMSQDIAGSQNLFNGDSEKEKSLLTYLSSIALRNSRSPKLNEFNGVFRLIPDLSIYYDRIRFEREASNPLKDKLFTWFALSFGIGPEVGFDSPLGYFYLNYVPLLGVNWITGPSGSTSTFGLSGSSELGYQLFISQRITMKLFARVYGGATDQWSKVLSDSSGETVTVQSATHTIFGLAIGYYFPEVKSSATKSASQ